MSSTTYDRIRDAYDLVFSDTYQKAPFVVDTLQRHGVRSILELGSGSGLFSIPIRQAGFHIEGLEISREMIAFMGKKHRDLTIHHGDIQNYRLNKEFDAILILSSTLVLLDSHESIGESLRCCHDHLPDKGILFLELPNHPVEIRKSNHTQEVHADDGNATIVVIQSHATDKLWRENWSIFRQENGEFTHETTICDELLYSPQTLASQLRDIGFEIIETYGDLFGNPFDENNSWRRVWICRKQ
uniref:Methyltransferase domain-containing protein n=1 Tax=Candidatus Kentrum sp. SD TaxID=2126332 RepID=A0A450YMZ6_9GAMM|nr:MAG: Methyltransferase domain-containing protein [Candidatus Kentron sp. SD]VFK48470.1 MAG: Methyltransferase domain-containing protein [Candidatus Kentron sp. SD]VFK79477.1 MAG: Methyltransferase domain-containing protein [Candidatus Kentron sp. SD]